MAGAVSYDVSQGHLVTYRGMTEDGSKVFFTSSGSEANDSQVKLVWYMNNALGRPNKKKIISRVKAYHGVTIAAASLTGLPNNHIDFDLPIAGVLHTDCPLFYRYAQPGETEEAFAPQGRLVAVVRRKGDAALPGGDDPSAVVEIRQINNHPHGRDIHRIVGLLRRPCAVVDRRGSAAHRRSRCCDTMSLF